MRSSTPLGLLVLSMQLFESLAEAQCTPTGSVGGGPDYVYLHADAAMNAQAPNAVGQATTSWRSCYSYGTQMGFPIPTMTPVTGASFASLTVAYKVGFNPNNPTSCASFVGATISVYEKAQAPSGATVQCSSFGYSTLIAHELGHFYGLNDVLGSGCPSIMGQADGFPHSVTGDDCAAADAARQTPSENYPTYPTCGEPCAGTCTTGGFCEATQSTSPIVISLRGNRFTLSGLDDPVSFDLDADGEPERSGWTARGGDTAFLALDLNGDGAIEDGSELFGNHTVLPDGSLAPNGFVALAVHDHFEAGGNGDLAIDVTDAVFERLSLWLDADHDGITDSGELRSLADHGIVRIDLDHRVDRRVDRHGNLLWLRGSGARSQGSMGVEQPILVYDVYFVRD